MHLSGIFVPLYVELANTHGKSEQWGCFLGGRLQRASRCDHGTCCLGLGSEAWEANPSRICPLCRTRRAGFRRGNRDAGRRGGPSKEVHVSFDRGSQGLLRGWGTLKISISFISFHIKNFLFSAFVFFLQTGKID